METNNLTWFEMKVLLDHFANFLSMEDRYKLMKEHPRIYNKWAGKEIVKVVRIQDGTDI